MQTKRAMNLSLRSTFIRFFIPFIIVILLTSSVGTNFFSFNEGGGSVQLNVNSQDLSKGEQQDNVELSTEEPESEITLTYTFPSPRVNSGIYDSVEMEGLQNLMNPGEPALPFDTARVLLPQGAELDYIEVTAGTEIYLPGEYKVEPAGEPVPLTEFTEEMLDANLLEPDEVIYNSNEPYPGGLYELVGTERFRGYDITVVNLFPVHFIPAPGQLYYFDSITLKIKLDNSKGTRSISSAFNQPGLNYRGLASDEAAVMDMVDNPRTVESYGLKSTSTGTRAGPSNPVWDMVIITNDTLNKTTGVDYTFQDLAAYRNSHGVNTTIMTVENITSNPNYWNTSSALFNDTAAQIRNFITHAYNNWGITYVLLGGDGDGKDVGGESGDNIIPARGFKESSDNNVPADLYYAALDGNWNNDKDTSWGEYPTECDWYAEVYVGRAPVDSAYELSNFVNKTLHYEETNSTYLEKVLMVGEYLWAGPPITWGGDYMDEVRDGSSMHGYTTVGIPMDITDVYYNVTTLYDRDWPSTKRWPKSELIKRIDDNIHIIHHLGHSNTLYNMKLNVTNADNFNNSEYFFSISQGCYNGAFDNRGTSSTKYYSTDSIAEHFVTEPHGSFATIGNSRYGYGSSGSTNGASQRFHRQFVDALYGEDMRDIGRANQDSKEDNIGFTTSWVGRWCYYEINLFGDPSLKMRDPVPPDHDIAVKSLSAPDHAIPGIQLAINSTLHNRGYCNETTVLVNFTVDGSVVNSTTIPFFEAASAQNVSFNWTPALGIYNVSIETKPVAGEQILINNRRYQVVIAGPDVSIQSASPPKPIWLKEKTTIPATVENLALTAVSNVKVILYIDGTDVFNTTIPSINASSTEDIILNWTPSKAGDNTVSIYAENLTNELSLEDNYFNTTVTVKVRPDIDFSPKSFELTVPQGKVHTVNLTVYNNGTSGLYYDVADYAIADKYRKIALISDIKELENITDTLDEIGLTDYTIYNNNAASKYTQNINVLKQYGLVIFYSASRAISLTEKLVLDEYLTKYGGNLIVTGYDSLGSPTDYNMAYVVRSRSYGDGPWTYTCKVTDPNHPITSGPFGSFANGYSFTAGDEDHDRARTDPDRGSKSISTVSSNVKLLVTDSVPGSGAKIVYWNGNRFTTDWDAKGTDNEILFKNLLVWAADLGSTDWLSELPTSGLINNDTSKEISVVVNTTELYSGKYSRNIVIASNDTDERAVLVPVNLTVPVPDHDIAVQDIRAPAQLERETEDAVNATLINVGTTAENNIAVKFMLDNDLLETKTIPQLGAGKSLELGFKFKPNSSVSVGVHTLAIEASAVPYENGTFNNIAKRDITIYTVPHQGLSPAAINLQGKENETLKTELTLTNTGTAELKSHFSSYHYVLEEKFTSTTLDTSKWPTKVGTPVINTAALNEPSGSYSLDIDGKDDAVESLTINLTNATGAKISFYVELGGHTYRPRSSATLYLDYYNKSSQWVNLWNRSGYGTVTGYRLGNITFDFYTYEFPEDAFHSNFKFRFRHSGVSSGLDDFFIDDIKFEYFAFNNWLTTNVTTISVDSGGVSKKVEVIANMTGFGLGIHHGTIYVTSNDPDSPLEIIPVTITILGVLDHIHLSRSNWTGTADENVTITAVGHDVYHREVIFTPVWSTTDPWGSVVNGFYQPGKVGSWMVYCNNSDNSISNSTEVTVLVGELASIVINPSTHTMTTDQMINFIATGYDSDGNLVNFIPTWTVSGGGTIDVSGKFEPSLVGVWTVYAQYGDVKASAKVIVNTGDLASIEINPTECVLKAGQTQRFIVKGFDADGNIYPVTPVWEITGGGTIDSTGKFKATTVGEWTLYGNFSAYYSSASIKVEPGELYRIELTPETATLTAGKTLTLLVAGYDAYDNLVVVTSLDWSAPSAAGLFISPGTFKGTKVGRWELTATASTSSGSVSDKCIVDINPASLAKLIIKPGDIEVAAGTQVQFHASGYDKYDNPVTGFESTWSVDGGGQIDEKSGLFTPHYAGNRTVSVVAEGIQASAVVKVTPGPLASLQVIPSFGRIAAGYGAQFYAYGYDAYGNEIPEDDFILTWSVDGGGFVSKSGFFMATQAGFWTLTATCKGVTDTADLEVLSGKLFMLKISPSEYIMKIDEQVEYQLEAYDQYNNLIPPGNLHFTWSVTGGGSITDEGVFTASEAGTWEVTVAEKIVDDSITASATVTVLPDKDTDSDGDTLPDLWEEQYGLNPYDPADASLDLDKDGATNKEEYEAGTNPAKSDSDGDGLPDGWELEYFFDPNDPTGENGHEGDPDFDTYTNLAEYQEGTDPRDGTDPSPDELEAPTTDIESEEKSEDRMSILPFLIALIIVIVIIIALFFMLKRKKEPAEEPVPPPEMPRDQLEEINKMTSMAIEDQYGMAPPMPPPEMPAELPRHQLEEINRATSMAVEDYEYGLYEEELR
ncbi:MAG: hypothetical protein JSV49_03640 [Thermoplasmata archaeon]|nr:MAG: hypothetical protein JSV49_03640 [Thermoplasmata archaeon]